MNDRPHIPNFKAAGQAADRLFFLFLIIATGIICYASSLDASFHFDDFQSIVRNRAIRDILDFGAIWQGRSTRFVAYLTFALNYRIHGLNVLGYHLFNLLVHLSASLTLYWFVKILFLTPELKRNPLAPEARNVALAVSLVFVSHPIETQAVTYIVQRIASLAALFYLLSVTLFVKTRVYYNENNFLHIPFYVASLGTALLAMFTKEIALTLPIAILFVEFFFFSPSFRKIWQRRSHLWPFLLTLPVIPLTWTLTRKPMVEHLGMAAETDTISRMDYLLTQFNVIRTYLRLLFLPLKQSIDYDYPISHRFLEPDTLASFVLLFLLLVLAFIIFKRSRLLSFGILWFYLTLMVESSLIPIRDVIFEHRLYLPSIGIFLSATVGLFHLLGQRKKTLFALYALMVVSASLATINRNITWREQVLIWHDAAKIAPRKFRVIVNRGAGYSYMDKTRYALKDYNLAISLNTNDATPYLNRGIHFLNEGHYASAVSDFNAGLNIQPGTAKLLLHRGLTYMVLEKYHLAYKDFRTATMLDPSNPLPMNALGTACHKLGRFDYARLAFTKAIALDGKYAAPYLNRGKTNRSAGNFRGAIEDFDLAAQLSPEMPEVFFQRALAYVAMNDYKGAIQDFTRAVMRDPCFAKAYANRGTAYHRLGLHARALVDLNRAAALNPNLPKLYRNRGKVYLALGQATQGTEDLQKAETLKTD